jgi:hypothetical protein
VTGLRSPLMSLKRRGRERRHVPAAGNAARQLRAEPGCATICTGVRPAGRRGELWVMLHAGAGRRPDGVPGAGARRRAAGIAEVLPGVMTQ